jgi:orotate phosphoribosyltransferase
MAAAIVTTMALHEIIHKKTSSKPVCYNCMYIMMRKNKLFFPRPLEARPLLALARRFDQTILKAADQPLHIIGVADTGVPLAAAIATHCAQMRPGIEVWLSIINAKAPENIITSPAPSTFGKLQTIVVDNAINSGATMIKTLEILRKKQIPVDLAVKIIDYQDQEEEEVGSLINAQTGVKVKSLFTYDEVGAAFRVNST